MSIILLAILLGAPADKPADAAQVPTPATQCAEGGRNKSSETSATAAYPDSYRAAGQIQRQVEKVSDCLRQPDVRSDYGAEDMWTEVDRRSGASAKEQPERARTQTVVRPEKPRPKP